MSSYVIKEDWIKIFAIDNYYDDYYYWYTIWKEWDNWFSININDRLVFESIEELKLYYKNNKMGNYDKIVNDNYKIKKEVTTKKWYIKQLKEEIQLLREENESLSKAYMSLDIKYKTVLEKNHKLYKENKNLNDLTNAWIWELQFSNLQKEHYKSLIEEVEVLVKKWIKKELIQKVISNWYKRAELDLAIHTDEIFSNDK